MRTVFMSLMALSAVALNAQETEEPTTPDVSNASEVVAAEEVSTSDEASCAN